MGLGPRAVCLILIIISAGCIGATGGETNPEGGQVASSPDKPQQLNNSSVKSFALEYEQQFLKQHLADRYDEENYGIGCCTTTKDAAVVAETSGKYYVQVLYPYYYSTSGGEADAASKALYVISEDTTNRIKLSHYTVTAEDPYSGPNQSTNASPPTIWVVNTGEKNREFSMSLRHKGRNELAYTHSMKLSGNQSVEFSQVVSRTGDYQLTLDAGNAEITSTYTNVDVNYTDISTAPDSVVIIITDHGTTIYKAPRRL